VRSHTNIFTSLQYFWIEISHPLLGEICEMQKVRVKQIICRCLSFLLSSGLLWGGLHENAMLERYLIGNCKNLRFYLLLDSLACIVSLDHIPNLSHIHDKFPLQLDLCIFELSVYSACISRSVDLII